MKDKHNKHRLIAKTNKKPSSPTTDKTIRVVLRERLSTDHQYDDTVRIIEELGLNHGAARVDIAVVNGVMHGYEIKSDTDNLLRLPDQIEAYNAIFDKVTIVVGASHLYDVIDMVPDWWGIILARHDSADQLILNDIRKPEQNHSQNIISIARLLWREEALAILENMNAATGVKTKTRNAVYERLASSLSEEALQKCVRETLCFRTGWRADLQPLPSGG